MFNVYYNIEFGTEKSINRFIMFKILVVLRQFLAFKYVFIEFAVPDYEIKNTNN